MGKVFYLMGKSASGKDKIYSRLLKEKKLHLHKLVPYTTRPIREEEQDGVEYYFVNREILEGLREQGKILEERNYQTVHGIWTYFTADDGQLDLEYRDYLGIGTLESYRQMKKHMGKDSLCPIYIEVEDGIRLERALNREKKQAEPKYAELCRRFLADSEDFSEEKLRQAQIEKRFFNNGQLEECLFQICKFIEENRDN